MVGIVLLSFKSKLFFDLLTAMSACPPLRSVFDADVSEVIVQVLLESSDSVPQRVLRVPAAARWSSSARTTGRGQARCGRTPGDRRSSNHRKSGGYAGDLP